MAIPENRVAHERRPCPPLQFIESHQLMPYIGLIPANEVHEWALSQILSNTGSLYNPDHFHLVDADVRFMWASSACEKKGRHVLGQAEEVAMRAGGWQKARMEQQMHEWFGEVVASTRINRYEKGVHEVNIETAQLLANVLEVPLAYLYTADNELAELMLLFLQLSQNERSDLLKRLQSSQS